MSVSIMWRPETDRGKSCRNGTSTELEQLQEVFGGGSDGLILTDADRDKLRAMAVASRVSNSLFDELADIIASTGSIRVWGEW